MVEGGSLENCCAERYRGFESYFLRHLLSLACHAGPFRVLGGIIACVVFSLANGSAAGEERGHSKGEAVRFKGSVS